MVLRNAEMERRTIQLGNSSHVSFLDVHCQIQSLSKCTMFDWSVPSNNLYLMGLCRVSYQYIGNHWRHYQTAIRQHLGSSALWPFRNPWNIKHSFQAMKATVHKSDWQNIVVVLVFCPLYIDKEVSDKQMCKLIQLHTTVHILGM